MSNSTEYRMAVLYQGTHSGQFIRLLTARFRKIRVRYYFYQHFNYSHLGNYHLILNHTDLKITGENHPILADIHPDYLINGRLVSVSKTFVAEAYEQIFGQRLMIYRKDTEPYPGRVFMKEEKQTFGEYRWGNYPIFNSRLVNQRFVGTPGEVYGVYFIFNRFLYMYRFVSDDYYVKLHNTRKREYFSFRQTARMLKPYRQKIFRLLDRCGVDFGRVDLVFARTETGEDTVYILDVNNKPLEMNYLEEAYRKTGLLEQSAETVEKMLITRIRKQNTPVYQGRIR